MSSQHDYTVLIRDFLDAANDDFSPGEVLMFMDNPHNVAWTEYMNEVGEAFFTISQKDMKAELLSAHETKLGYRPHMQIYRGSDLVWGGWLGEIDETETDVIFYGYSYLSGFYDLITAYDKKWTGQTIATIVDEVLATGVGKAKSRVHWITEGTIQNPYTDDTQTTTITMSLYRAPYKRILSVWRELATYGSSDTSNHVIFEITPAGVFNFWRDRGSTVSNSRASFGGGDVRSYRRIRRPAHRRNTLFAVGTSPTDVNLNVGKARTSLRNAMGLSEEPIYLSFVRDADELSRVTLLRLKRAVRVDSDLFVSFRRNTITPFRATGAQYAIGDTVTIDIDNGVSNVQETKVVVGQQVVYNRLAENVRLLLADTI